MVIMWVVCAILTATGILPEENLARTDSKLKILHEAPWFNFPYPGWRMHTFVAIIIANVVDLGQWGSPTFSAAAVFGMLAGVIAGAIESVGDYYACAQFCRKIFFSVLMRILISTLYCNRGTTTTNPCCE